MVDDLTTMAQENQSRSCKNGGRSSKKPKPKKIPQRGLGVAQLEKIRLEEQQKKNAAAILSSQQSALESARSSSYMNLPIQNPYTSNQGSSFINLASSGSPPSDFRPPLFLQQHMVDSAKVPVSSTVPLGNSVGFEPFRPNFSAAPRHERERIGVDSGFHQFPTRSNFESNPMWSLPNLVQRAPQQYHQPQSSASLVNVSSGNSPTPVPHYFIEPPSNQNHSGNGAPMRPVEEEKLASLKRPYPFSLDVPPEPPFPYKRLYPPIERRTNPSVSCGNENVFSFGACNSIEREIPSCSASNSEPNSSKENENFNGNFLTLAPPTPTIPTSCAPLKLKSSLASAPAFLAFHNQKNPEFESQSTQGIVEGQVPPPTGYNRLFSQQNQQLFCFFPPAAADEAQNGQNKARVQQNGDQVEESVDLNLKL